MPCQTKEKHESCRSLKAMDEQLTRAADRHFCWFPELGYGYYPVKAGTEPYDKAYWDEYVERGKTAIGRRLNEFRVNLVKAYTSGVVLDVGIGAGTFIETRKAIDPNTITTGYDVNPCGIRWLKSRDLWCDWRNCRTIESVSMWDVLEHLTEPKPLLDKIKRYLFVSLPLFQGSAHAMRSKHYKPQEHCWYFTDTGFRRWIGEYGFKVEEANAGEQRIGREDVMTYVCRRWS